MKGKCLLLFLFLKQLCFLDTTTNVTSEYFGVDLDLTMKNNLQILFSETIKDLSVWTQIFFFLTDLSSSKPGTYTYFPIHRDLWESKFTSILWVPVLTTHSVNWPKPRSLLFPLTVVESSPGMFAWRRETGEPDWILAVTLNSSMTSGNSMQPPWASVSTSEKWG